MNVTNLAVKFRKRGRRREKEGEGGGRRGKEREEGEGRGRTGKGGGMDYIPDRNLLTYNYTENTTAPVQFFSS